jgi:hypothetical protein
VDFFKELGYATPDCYALAKPLLESVYDNTRVDVKEIAKDQKLGLVIDKLTVTDRFTDSP